MKSSITLKEEIRNLATQVEAVAELATIENRELNDDEKALVSRVSEDKPKLEAQLENAMKVEAIVASKLQAPLAERRQAASPEAKDIPVRFKSAFRKGVFNTAEDAYSSGQFVIAKLFGKGDMADLPVVRNARRYIKENGIRNAMTTGDNTKGGFLVPEPLEASIIELREQYGVFGREAQQVTMGDSVMNVPKLSSELTSYYVGENTAPTASDMAIVNIRLEARKLAAFAAVSNELNEDSVISVAEMLARSVAQVFATQEDQAGFNGDGSSTYGGMVGLKGALAAGSTHDALSGNTTFGTLDTADFETCMGKLKMYGGIRPKWYISQAGWANSMQRLMDAVGGNSGYDLARGMPMQFLGFPVVISQVLPTALSSTASTILAYFGDLAMASMLGRRRGLTIKADESFYFSQDAVAVLATQRYDINVHDRGTSTEGGAVIALKTPAS